jgi:hypothetical protein
MKQGVKRKRRPFGQIITCFAPFDFFVSNYRDGFFGGIDPYTDWRFILQGFFQQVVIVFHPLLCPIYKITRNNHKAIIVVADGTNVQTNITFAKKEMDSTKLIDVKEVLQRKAPKMAKKIPGFLVNYLIRTIHQEEINDIIVRYQDLDGVYFMQALVEGFDLALEVFGKERIPVGEQRYIFASNHPLGGLDGICLAAELGRRYGSKIICPANDLLMFIPNLQSLFVPINKHGSQGRHVAQKIDEAFASDKQILTFPAGLCSRKQKGKICDLEWKKSFIQKAIEYKRDIVPVYFEGRNSNFFYRLANFRKRLCIKMNIEMVYLPDEMFRQRHNQFRIYFGEPVPWQTFDSSKKPAEWAEWMKRQVYSLCDK